MYTFSRSAHAVNVGAILQLVSKYCSRESGASVSAEEMEPLITPMISANINSRETFLVRLLGNLSQYSVLKV